MFRAIAKNTALATCLVLGLSYGANAQNADPYEDYKFSCSSPSAFFDISNSECESFEVVYLEDNLQELNSQPSQNEIAQSRRRRRTGKYYAGFTGGAFFPIGDAQDETNIPGDPLLGTQDLTFSSIGYGTAFGGSIFGGMKISKIINAELELFLGFGGLDTDEFDNDLSQFFDQANLDVGYETDADYSAIALYISPKFEFPLSRGGRGATLFISPGIGLSNTNISYKPEFTSSDQNTQNLIDQETQNNPTLYDERDDSQTGISFQVKAGGTFPISRNVSILGQTRFATLPTEDGYDALNLFSAEAGLQFKF